jgi:hypothetical protein
LTLNVNRACIQIEISLARQLRIDYYLDVIICFSTVILPLLTSQVPGIICPKEKYMCK